MAKTDTYSLGVPIRPLRCPYCLGTNLSVTDSRDIHNTRRRRRRCEDCKGKFSTSEFYMGGPNQGVNFALCRAMGLPALQIMGDDMLKEMSDEIKSVVERYVSKGSS